jgi:ankyrin repeat protein
MSQKDLNNMSVRELNHELLYVLVSTPIDVEKVRQLITAGADPKEGIFLAKDTGNLAIVNALTDAGEDINYLEPSLARKDLNNMNVEDLNDELCEVLTSTPVDINRVRQLIAAGASPDDNAMSFAIDTGKLEIVKILVDAGVDVNYIDEEFETPLLWAKNALILIESNENDEVEVSEYNEIVNYLEEVTTQETKDIVEEIMRQNNT